MSRPGEQRRTWRLEKCEHGHYVATPPESRFMCEACLARDSEIERLLGELLFAFEGLDDDDMIPVCAFMRGVGCLQGFSTWEADQMVAALPSWESVGWFRQNMRRLLADLARGVVQK